MTPMTNISVIEAEQRGGLSSRGLAVMVMDGDVLVHTVHQSGNFGFSPEVFTPENARRLAAQLIESADVAEGKA